MRAKESNSEGHCSDHYPISSHRSLCGWPTKQIPLPLPAPPPEIELQFRPQEIELPIADAKDRAKIDYVIETVGTKSFASLWWNHEEELRKIDKELVHVHPFQFLETVFGEDSKIAQFMPEIFKYDLTMGPFIEGLERGFALQEHRDKFWDYLPSFAKKVGMNKRQVISYLHPRQNLEGFVKELIQIHC